MFCKKCGNELKDGVRFCNKCGAKVDSVNVTPPNDITLSQSDNVTTEDNSNIIPEIKMSTFCKNNGNEINDGVKSCGKCDASIVNNDNNNVNEHKSLLLPKIIALIALICFFFPFMSVSCSGATYDISGTDLIFGDSDNSEYLDSNDDTNIFNWFVCIALNFGIIALFVRKGNAINGVSCTVTSCIALLIFRFTAKFSYKMGDTRLSDLNENFINIEFRFALYLAMILFITSAIMFWQRADDNEKNEVKKEIKSDDS